MLKVFTILILNVPLVNNCYISYLNLCFRQWLDTGKGKEKSGKHRQM